MRKFLPVILLVVVCEGVGRIKKVFIWRFIVHDRLIICVYLAFLHSGLPFMYYVGHDKKTSD